MTQCVILEIQRLLLAVSESPKIEGKQASSFYKVSRKFFTQRVKNRLIFMTRCVIFNYLDIRDIKVYHKKS
jgi:hypothetical protein